MARPRLYKTADDLDKAIDAYFKTHNSKDNAPKWHEMLNEINISDDTLLRYRTGGEDIYPGYAEVVKKTERRHCAFWQQLAMDHPNLQSFCMFELKQPHNGGFIDRPQAESVGEVTVKVKLDGVGGA